MLQFSKLYLYNQHQSCHSRLEGAKFVCKAQNCGKKILNYIYFRKHNNLWHKKLLFSEKKSRKFILICKQHGCKFKGKNKNHLKNHILNHFAHENKVFCSFSSCKN